jgi:hypothetical protein
MIQVVQAPSDGHRCRHRRLHHSCLRQVWVQQLVVACLLYSCHFCPQCSLEPQPSSRDPCTEYTCSIPVCFVPCVLCSPYVAPGSRCKAAVHSLAGCSTALCCQPEYRSPLPLPCQWASSPCLTTKPWPKPEPRASRQSNSTGEASKPGNAGRESVISVLIKNSTGNVNKFRKLHLGSSYDCFHQQLFS